MNLNINKSDWIKVKLNDVCEWYQKNIPNDEQLDFGIEYYVTANHIDSDSIKFDRYNELVDGQKGPTITKHFEKGDLLLSTRSVALRKAAIAPVDGVTGEKLLVLRVKPESTLLSELMPFVFQSIDFWEYAQNSASGSVNKFTSWTKIREYEFLLPPKDQQAQLAKLLWAMDEVIEREKEVLARTEVIKNSLFKKFTNSEENWTKHKIKDLMTFNYGSALKESDRKEGEHLVVTSSGIQGTHNEYKTEGPGIVVGRKGNVGQVTWLDDNFWTTDTAYFILINEEFKHVPLKFFYYLLIASNLKKHSIATAVPGLNRDDALLTNVFLPTENEIRSYLDKFSILDKKLTDITNKISSSQSLQKSLINQIF